MSKKVESTEIRQDMIADDVRYHAEKLGFGGHGAHEGWIKAEEEGATAKATVNAATRQQMIAVAAYYLAEKRGFAGSGANDDWMKAEAETDAMLGNRIEEA
jgi:hypothetical protein